MRVLPSVAAIVGLSTAFAVSSFGQINPASLTITGYQLVSETRATITQSYFTYSATLINTGPALPSITATATPRIPGVFSLVNGSNNLHFPPAAHNAQITSTNTFTILLDRTQQFYFNELTWSFNTPVANAGSNQTATVGSTVTLNASASTNPSGIGTLSYIWTLTTVPSGSNVALQNANSVETTFVPDVAGTYIATVTVSNGSGLDYSSTTISTTASAPAANAGPNQTVDVGSTVHLDGSKSVDFDGNPLTYTWTLVQAPQGNQAALAGANTVSPTFMPDLPGTYVAQLVVNDGNVNSAPSTVTIVTSPINTPPVANAGPSQSVTVGAPVQLDGSKSTDVNGNPLTYRWSLITLAPGSRAALNSATIVNPTFTADVAGTYIAQLIVNDGVSDSQPATVTITTSSILPPVANAGPNQTVGIETTVSLNGSGTDPQNLPLTLQWSLISTPKNSTAALSSTTASNPTFIADQPGNYVVQLTVNNGTLNSPPATVTITTTVSAPVANPGPNQTVAPGATITLSGSGSSDPQNVPLTYSWSLLSVPTGSTAQLSLATSVSPTFVADLAGTYVAQLIVNNGFLSSPPVTVTIAASAGNELILTPNPLNLTNATGNLTVSIGNAAGANGLVVSLGLYDPTIISAPQNVTIPANATSTTVTITPVGPGSTNIYATAPSFRPAETTVNVSSASLSLSLGSALGITRTLTGTITLSGAAPSPVAVALSVSTPGVISFPAIVPIAAGAQSNTFTITGVATGQTTITASATGYAGSNSTVSVAPLGAIILQQNASTGVGQAASFSVSLATPASAPVTITLSSSDTSKLTVSSSVSIAQGATAPTTPAQITGVNFGSATITAAGPGFTGASATVQVGASLSLSPSNSTIAQNSGGALTLMLSSNAPANGLVVTLQSNNTAVATIAANVTIPGNANSVIVPVTSVGTGVATITASAAVSGVTSGTATINVVGGIGINTAGVVAGVVNIPYTATLTAGGGTPPYSFSGTGLPAGLSISATGQITGTPTSPGTSSASITVADSSTPTRLTATTNASIIINPAVSITTAGLPSGITGQSYSAPIAAAGGRPPLTFSASGLPAGLSINSSTGQITGTPTGPGTATVSVTANDSSSPNHSSATKQLSITINNALSITTTTFNAGTVNVAYNAAVSATGGASPYTFSATGLPAGLSISSTSGQITGTPTSVGTSTVSVKVIDSGSPQQTATANLSLTIATPVLAISTASLTAGTVNVAYNVSVSATGGSMPYSFSATGLPAGLSISAGGQITGTPNSVGTSTVALKVTDSSNPKQTSTANLPLTIAPPQLAINTTTLASGKVNAAYSATLTATGGVTPYTFSATGLPVGLSISASGQISGTPTTVGTSAVAVKVTDSSNARQTASATLSLTIAPPVLSIATASLTSGVVNVAFSATVSATGGTTPYTFSATGLPAGLSISAGGQITGTPTTAGTSTVALKVVDVGNPQQSATASVSLTIAPQPLVITTMSLAPATVNAAYGASVVASGGATPYTFSATGLPAGLSISAGGQITGAPTAAGVTTVVVKVVDASNPQLSQTASLQLTVNPAKLVITTSSLTAGTVNSAYSATVSAAGGTTGYTFSATGLPAGLSINSSGQITGTPTVAGTSSVAVKATDSGNPQQIATAALSLIINAAPLSITTTSLTGGTATTAYSASVAATGGTTPYTFSATGLPAGLSMSAGGQISGTPTAVGANSVAVTVKDSGTPQQTVTKTLVLSISAAPLVITTKTLGSGMVNKAYTASVAAAGGAAPYNFSGTGLPAGLSINSSGQITGTPTTPGTSTVSVKVTDASTPQMSTTSTLSLTIAPAPLMITTSNLTGGTAGTSYPATQIQATGGTAPLTFSANGLDGLTISSSGLITGTPTNSGSFTVNVTVRDSSSPQMTASASLPLDIQQVVVTGNSLSVTSATVGQGLEVPITITFSPATSAATALTVTSSNPSAVLLASKPGSAGQSSISFSGLTLIPAGTSSFAVYAQGVAKSGSATITAGAFAAGYANGQSTITLANSGFVLAGQNGNGGAITVNQSSSTPLTVSAVQLDSSGNVAQVQQVSGSSPVTVNLSLGNTGLGTLSPASVIFAGGTSSVTTSFNAATITGSTTITAAEPTGFATPAGNGNVVPVTVQPALVIPQNVTVGQGLETTAAATFQGAITQPITTSNPITITSSDASKLLLATNPTDPGTASIQYTGCSFSNPTCLGITSTPTFYVYGLVSTGSASYTVNVPGLGTGKGIITFGPSGFVAIGPFGLGTGISTTSESQPTTFDVQPALLDSGDNYVAQQSVAGNVSVNVSVKSATTSVGTITTSPLTFTGGVNDISASFQPAAQGTSVLSVSAPSPFVTPAQFASLTATVTTPKISIDNGDVIGQNLEQLGRIILAAPAPTNLNVTLVVTSGSMLLSTTGTDAGGNLITVAVPAGSNNATFYMYAEAGTGTATITASAAGYATGTGTETMVPSGVIVSGPFGPGFGYTAQPKSATPITVSTVQIDSASGNAPQPLAGNVGSLSVALTNSNPALGTIPANATITAGSSTGTVNFVAGSSAGITSITVNQPAGYQAPSQYTNVQVTVN